jgi:hypothetical protein
VVEPEGGQPMDQRPGGDAGPQVVVAVGGLVAWVAGRQ